MIPKMHEDPQASPKKKRRFPSPGFLVSIALILVLVVAVIVSICPGGMSRSSVKRAEAKVGAGGLAVTIQNYYTEYGTLPAGTTAQIMNALRGANPRKIPFFEINT